jgi:diaminohydroxyphosphoribosylaminopyrimidine deaminase/5-amino-6-(5-phosphoribosylamino)uracil reductase
MGLRIEDVKIGQLLTPAEAMQLAIDEGKKGAGFVSPNPMVGCTIVDRNHRFLSVGYHARVGHAHAEIEALAKIEDRSVLRDAHAYVTLEPCAHQGRTGSCAQAMAPLGFASVTFAVQDPNPLVAGRGADILRAAGVRAVLLADREDVPEVDELTAQAEELAEIFLHFMREKKPFVAIKVATTLDGKMATSSGESKWITGEAARAHTHKMRARYDAIVIGRNTFVADNPSLNVRHPEFPGFQNRVVLLDPAGTVLAQMSGSNLVKVRAPDAVWVLVGKGVKPKNPTGVRVIEIPLNDMGLFEMEAVLSRLKLEGITSLMVEGGSQTYANFFAGGLVQRLHAYVAPSILGGKHGVAWSAGFGKGTMAEKIRLRRSEREVLGEDLYWTARVEFA